MQMRALGQSGIQSSVIGLGTWAIGGWMWGGTDEAEAIRAIHAAIDAGINLIDTAPAYGFGCSEEIVAKAIKDRREKVVLATKCGLVWDGSGGELFFNSDEKHPTSGEAKYKVHRYLGAASIRREVEASLSRLGVECIDLYQTHWQDPTTPIAETMETLLALKAEGKIRAIGCSNATPAEMDEYRAVGALDVDQELYSMLDRGHEEDNLAYCAKNNVAFLSYSTMAQGLLTGKITPERTFEEGDQRNEKPRFSVENRKKVADMLACFQPIADAHDLTLGQLAIAWTFHQTGCSHVLVGARNPAQAIENAKAGAVTLSADECATMREAILTHAQDIP